MTENNNYENYKRISHFVLPRLSQNILDIYDQCVKDAAPGKYIYENYLKEIVDNYKDMTLNTIIAYSLYSSLSKENISKALRSAKGNRRTWKKNWFRSIKDEMNPLEKMKPRNPQYLRHYAEAKATVFKIDRVDPIPDVNDIMAENYRQIENWLRDKDALVMNFMFRSQKQPKAQAGAFLCDLTLESLTIVQTDYHGSIEGFNMNFPTTLSENPIFSYRQADMIFSPEVIEDELSILNKYRYEDEEKSGEIVVKIADGIPFDQKKQSVSDVLEKYQINVYEQRELDMRDRDIVMCLFSLINGETLSNKHITVNMKEFCKEAFNLNRPRSYNIEDLAKRLEKLKNYSYRVSVVDKKTKEPMEITIVNLIDNLYINFSEGYFQFTPSEQWIKTYIQQKYTSILTDSYKNISSSQTRGIMMMLQKERIIAFNSGSLSKILTLKYFRSHMKLFKMNNAALIREMTMHFTILKDKGIVVEDFQFIDNGASVCIYFVPLNHMELIAYDLNKDCLTDSSIVEHAKHVSETGA